MIKSVDELPLAYADKEEALDYIAENLMVNPTDSLDIVWEDYGRRFFLLWRSVEMRQVKVIAEGETLVDLVWDLATSKHPESARQRLAREGGGCG